MKIKTPRNSFFYSSFPYQIFKMFLYTVSQKVSPLTFDNNFGKCGPIFKILSTVDS